MRKLLVVAALAWTLAPSTAGAEADLGFTSHNLLTPWLHQQQPPHHYSGITFRW
jgi:hypothetical protein